MHAFVHSSYVSERVLAQADVCMFVKWMVLVSIYPWSFHLDTEIEPIYEQTNGPY